MTCFTPCLSSSAPVRVVMNPKFATMAQKHFDAHVRDTTDNTFSNSYPDGSGFAIAHYLHAHLIGFIYHAPVPWAPDPLYAYTISCFAKAFQSLPKDAQQVLMKTKSDEKIKISVLGDATSPGVLFSLVDTLAPHLAVDATLFLPPTNDHLVQSPCSLLGIATLLETASPFASYSAFLCGFPHYLISGTIEEYEQCATHLDSLIESLTLLFSPLFSPLPSDSPSDSPSPLSDLLTPLERGATCMRLLATALQFTSSSEICTIMDQILSVDGLCGSGSPVVSGLLPSMLVPGADPETGIDTGTIFRASHTARVSVMQEETKETHVHTVGFGIQLSTLQALMKDNTDPMRFVSSMNPDDIITTTIETLQKNQEQDDRRRIFLPQVTHHCFSIQDGAQPRHYTAIMMQCDHPYCLPFIEAMGCRNLSAIHHALDALGIDDLRQQLREYNDIDDLYVRAVDILLDYILEIDFIEGLEAIFRRLAYLLLRNKNTSNRSRYNTSCHNDFFALGENQSTLIRLLAWKRYETFKLVFNWIAELNPRKLCYTFGISLCSLFEYNQPEEQELIRKLLIKYRKVLTAPTNNNQLTNGSDYANIMQWLLNPANVPTGDILLYHLQTLQLLLAPGNVLLTSTLKNRSYAHNLYHHPDPRVKDWLMKNLERLDMKDRSRSAHVLSILLSMDWSLDASYYEATLLMHNEFLHRQTIIDCFASDFPSPWTPAKQRMFMFFHTCFAFSTSNLQDIITNSYTTFLESYDAEKWSIFERGTKTMMDEWLSVHVITQHEYVQAMARIFQHLCDDKTRFFTSMQPMIEWCPELLCDTGLMKWYVKNRLETHPKWPAREEYKKEEFMSMLAKYPQLAKI